ncbi:MAG: hypothetical protein V4592_12255 [Bacteroidota bacterium]
MDEDKLHTDLNNRIREVFDNYEDTTADEGWALLRQKFPEKEKDRGLAWLWYAAAAVVLLGLGLWFISKPDETKNLVVKNLKTIIQPDKKVNRPAIIDTSINNVANHIAQIQMQHPQTKPIVQAGAARVGQSPVLPTVQPVPPVNQAANQIANNRIQKGSVNNLPTVSPAPVTNPPATVTDPLVNRAAITDALAANQQNKALPVKAADSTGNKPDQYVAVKPADASKQSSADALNKLLAEKTPDKVMDAQKKSARKAMLSVYAATYFNYAQGSQNNINVGAGFSSDFRISNKLKLSTGVAIAQNTLKYDSGTQPSQNGRLSASVAPPAQDALNQIASGVSPSSGGSQLNATPTAIVPTLKNYNASLIGLDIPINLKYQFNPQKSDTYISAGLSSGTFINETYVLNYAFAQHDQQNTTHTSFNNFDFAKTLNLSFGVGYPLGKSNRLIVEPFLKYPLDGLGSQQIKFGAGGINLKLNFQSTKK